MNAHQFWLSMGEDIAGAGTATIPMPESSGEGHAGRSATAGGNVPAITAAGVGHGSRSGSLAVSLPAITAAGVGGHEFDVLSQYADYDLVSPYTLMYQYYHQFSLKVKHVDPSTSFDYQMYRWNDSTSAWDAVSQVWLQSGSPSGSVTLGSGYTNHDGVTRGPVSPPEYYAWTAEIMYQTNGSYIPPWDMKCEFTYGGTLVATVTS